MTPLCSQLLPDFTWLVLAFPAAGGNKVSPLGPAVGVQLPLRGGHLFRYLPMWTLVPVLPFCRHLFRYLPEVGTCWISHRCGYLLYTSQMWAPVGYLPGVGTYSGISQRWTSIGYLPDVGTCWMPPRCGHLLDTS